MIEAGSGPHVTNARAARAAGAIDMAFASSHSRPPSVQAMPLMLAIVLMLALFADDVGIVGAQTPLPGGAPSCTVPPRARGPLDSIIDSATPEASVDVPLPAIRELPSGSPAGGRTRDDVGEATTVLAACVSTGDILRWSPLLTDTFLRQLQTASVTGAGVGLFAATPATGRPLVTVLAIDHVLVLGDDRLAAIVTFSGVRETHLASDYTVLLIFDVQDDRLLLDRVAETIWPGDPDVPPVAIADLYVIPEGTPEPAG